MPRKIILKEGGLNGSDAPSGFQFLGFDSETLSLKKGATISAIGGGGDQSLSDTLSIGNITDGNNIILSNNDTINAANGGGQLDLRADSIDSNVKLTGDTIIFDGDVNAIDITLTDLQSATDLKIGSTYRITDSSQGEIYVKAIDNDSISNEVIKKFFIVPDDYYTSTATSAQGVFDANEPVDVTAGQFWIWGGRLWECTTSGTGIVPDNDYTLPAANFTKLDTSDVKYEVKYMKSIYDLDRDWISKTWDWKGNVLGLSLQGILFGKIANINSDIVDWGDESIHDNSNSGFIYNNSNNSTINNNSNNGDINGNSNSGTIVGNSNGGGILWNHNNSVINGNSNNGGIINNSNGGFIISNSNSGSIFNNSNDGEISNNTSDGGTTFTIQNNQNNGEIRYNNSTANISIEFNQNNGRIGPPGNTHADRATDITDTIVGK